MARAVISDELPVTTIRKCILYPADGSEPRLVDMVNREITDDDPSTVRVFSQVVVDVLVSYGTEVHKARACHPEGLSKHLVYYNLSPKLPLNRCLARIIGVDPNKPGSMLFWRGDVVVMKYEEAPIHMSMFIKCLDADLSAAALLEDWFKKCYRDGLLDRELRMDEFQMEFYRSHFCDWYTRLSATITGRHPYWGDNWRMREAEFQGHIDELNDYIRNQEGRPRN